MSQIIDFFSAIRIFRELEDSAMVLALEEVENLEEKNLLFAQIYTALGDYEKAEEMYLESSQPIEALNVSFF